MAKRQIRDKIKLSEEEMLKPLDIEKFGSDSDPCFGKLYSLSSSECKRCGDSEICGSVFAQRLNSKREIIESGKRFKDIELSKIPQKAVDMIHKLRAQGYKDIRINRLVRVKYKLDKIELTNWLKNGK